MCCSSLATKKSDPFEWQIPPSTKRWHPEKAEVSRGYDHSNLFFFMCLTSVSYQPKVEILLASGFELNRAPPPLLSTSQSGEECMVLPPEKEDTSLLVKVRRMLVTCAVNQLGMKAEELPKFKQPPRLTDPGDHAVGRKKPPASSGEFNPYQGQRYDAKSAAVGRNLGPDGNYESTTEKQLQQLQTQQAKLEKSLHKPLADRELSAILPGANKTVTATDSMDVDGPSDGSLLATRMKQMEQERRQREEGGFTTKAMRDLQQLKKQKVYSHVQLRIQFPDGSSLEAKFLPKETVATVKEVILSAFVMTAFDFELYVAPPRRQLEMGSTLESEGLVPAAKVFVSWKVNRAPTKAAPVGSFMKPELFRHQAGQAFPAAQSLLESKKAAPKKKAASKEVKKSSREEDMLKRMMGGKGGLGGSNRRNTKKDDKGSGGGKPKWFRR